MRPGADIHEGLHWVVFQRGEKDVQRFGIAHVFGEFPFFDVALLFDFDDQQQAVKLKLLPHEIISLVPMKVATGNAPVGVLKRHFRGVRDEEIIDRITHEEDDPNSFRRGSNRQ